MKSRRKCRHRKAWNFSSPGYQTKWCPDCGSIFDYSRAMVSLVKVPRWIPPLGARKSVQYMNAINFPSEE